MKILVCNPKHFEVSYEINPWMKNQIGFVDSELAKRQWNTLVDSLSKVSELHYIDSVSGLPDMVFTANAGILINDNFIVSKFATKERQPEEEYFGQWAESQDFIHNVVVPSDVNFEGEGDCLKDCSGWHWLGHGFRSEEKSANIVADYCTEVSIVKLVDPRWYHLDTAFCPLKNNTVMWYPNAFDENSQDIIRNSFRYHIDLSLEDALKFAANCVVVNDKLFLPRCSEELVKKLNKIGYNVETFDLSEFLKSGGAAKCLTLYLN